MAHFCVYFRKDVAAKAEAIAKDSGTGGKNAKKCKKNKGYPPRPADSVEIPQLQARQWIPEGSPFGRTMCEVVGSVSTEMIHEKFLV